MVTYLVFFSFHTHWILTLRGCGADLLPLVIGVFCIYLFQSMIGHCLGAAGGLEAIACVKAITTGWLHPSINQFVCVRSFSVLADLFFNHLRSSCMYLSLKDYFPCLQDPEPSVEFDTVANKKQQHEVNVGENAILLNMVS